MKADKALMSAGSPLSLTALLRNRTATVMHDRQRHSFIVGPLMDIVMAEQVFVYGSTRSGRMK